MQPEEAGETLEFSRAFSGISFSSIPSWVKRMGEEGNWVPAWEVWSPRTLEASYLPTNGGRKPNHPLIWMLFSPPLSMLSLCLFELSPCIWSP